MDRPERLALSLSLLFSTVLLALDILDDLEHHSGWSHVALELLTVAALVLVILWQARKILIRGEAHQMALKNLEEVKQELEAFQRETIRYSAGLKEKTRKRLVDWALTEAELEVALLVLSGLSTKEIAGRRETSEKTVTQQLSQIYQKSGLRGRNEFSAFFLEHLFEPNQK